jgi:hypothetical protein
MDVETKEEREVGDGNSNDNESGDESLETVTEIIFLEESQWVEFSQLVMLNSSMVIGPTRQKIYSRSRLM